MSYDHWKTTNPDDRYLESAPQSDEDEPGAEHDAELQAEE
jgi:hypothetical protein